MTFTEQLKLRDIKKIAKYQEKIQIKESNEPFMVECIDDEDYYHDSMWNAWISRWKISSISVWKQYTVDEIKTSRKMILPPKSFYYYWVKKNHPNKLSGICSLCT